MTEVHNLHTLDPYVCAHDCHYYNYISHNNFSLVNSLQCLCAVIIMMDVVD